MNSQGLSFFTYVMGLVTAADPMEGHGSRPAWSGGQRGFPEAAAFKLRMRWEPAPEGEWEGRAVMSERVPETVAVSKN